MHSRLPCNPAKPSRSPPHPHAQVWAHPDDLATIIQGIRLQEQLGGPRLVSIAVQGWWGKLGWLGCKVLCAMVR